MILRALDYIYREIIEFMDEWNEDTGNILIVSVEDLGVEKVTEELLVHILDFKVALSAECENEKLSIELDSNVLYSSYCSRVDQSHAETEMQYQEFMDSRGVC